MPSYNKVIVMGNLTRDPEMRTVGANAVKTCRFTLAINERRRDRSGNPVDAPVFVEIDAWDRLAELCVQYLRKGRGALVEGRLQSDVWEKDGMRMQKLRIRASAVKFMPQPQQGQYRPAEDAQAPFGAGGGDLYDASDL